MLPAGDVTQKMFNQVLGYLSRGDIMIEGANSNFHDTLRRYEQAEEKGIEMLDVGASGGIITIDKGYPMMVGGKQEPHLFLKICSNNVFRQRESLGL